MPANDSTHSTDLTPYATLTPDCVLNALDSLGDAQIRADGRLLALNSYENRVYQIGLEEGPLLVAKFYRPGRWTDRAILEEHAFAEELAAQEIPVVAPLRIAGATLHAFAGHRFALFPRRGGRAPELGDAATLEWLGRLIGRIHAIGALQRFAERPPLDIVSFGEEPRDYLLAHGFIPDDLLDAWRSVVDQALDGVRHGFSQAGRSTLLRLHGDCHAGNILWNPPDAVTGGGPHFVDFDDARMGPAVQDLWMLLSGERAEMEQQLDSILTGYRRFHDFNPRELYLIEALRTLRLIHYAGWLARRWDDPAFPRAFPWFNTQRYWQDRILELREQIALMEEPPLAQG
jgi:Ser/Thr protein kinase RdoA (MazF antagonist)